MVKVNDWSTLKLPFDPKLAVERLLRAVPPEHLVGLSTIHIVDTAVHESKQLQGAEGVYCEKWKDEPATIGIALGVVLKGVPRWVLYISPLPRLLLASALYHEVGHHYQLKTHGISKRKEESYARMYRNRMLVKSFSGWFRLIRPIGPLLRYFYQFLKKRYSQ